MNESEEFTAVIPDLPARLWRDPESIKFALDSRLRGNDIGLHMQTISKTLKDARVRRKFSLETLSTKTKIRREFLEAIEKEEWNRLPEFPVVLGFIKSIAATLNLSVEAAAALLKRDYPPKKLSINPKPDVSKKFVWSPKMTFWLGIIAVSVGVLGYLIFQYIRFISPPKLVVDFPKEGQVITERHVNVAGVTGSDAVIKVNNQPVLVDEQGNFSTQIEVVEETREIIVVANSRSGKESVVKRSISVDFGGTE